MANPKPPGRMIRRTISRDSRVANLSPRAVSLFFYLTPHFDSHGKMNGDPLYVKGEIVPLVAWFTIPVIKKCLGEINELTNMKWFMGPDKCLYLEDLEFKKNQDLREYRLGKDYRPSFQGDRQENSRSSPGVVPPEVKGKIRRIEVKGHAADGPRPSGRAGASSATKYTILPQAPEPEDENEDTEVLGPLEEEIAGVIPPLSVPQRTAIECVRKEIAEKILSRPQAIEKLKNIYSIPPQISNHVLPEERQS